MHKFILLYGEFTCIHFIDNIYNNMISTIDDYIFIFASNKNIDEKYNTKFVYCNNNFLNNGIEFLKTFVNNNKIIDYCVYICNINTYFKYNISIFNYNKLTNTTLFFNNNNNNINPLFYLLYSKDIDIDIDIDINIDSDNINILFNDFFYRIEENILIPIIPEEINKNVVNIEINNNSIIINKIKNVVNKYSFFSFILNKGKYILTFNYSIMNKIEEFDKDYIGFKLNNPYRFFNSFLLNEPNIMHYHEIYLDIPYDDILIFTMDYAKINTITFDNIKLYSLT